MEATEESEGLHPVVQTVNNYIAEARQAKQNRMKDNADNFNCYHMRQDWSHKNAGQSKEFLAKQYMAVEQITMFLQQALTNQDEWFDLEEEPGVLVDQSDPAALTAKDMKKLMVREFDNLHIEMLIPDGIKLGVLGSLMVAKVHGLYQPKYNYFTQDDGFGRKKLMRGQKSVWRLRIELIRQEDWYPDPTGNGLYEIEEIEMDYHDLVALAKANPQIYDMAAIESLKSGSVDTTQKAKKSRETDQNTTLDTFRKRIRIRELWGTILDPVTGDVLHENIVAAVANDLVLIRPPAPNPFWHGESPYVAEPIVRVPHSVWHKALMDAPTKHNHAINEIYNLMFDSAMMSTFGIKQIREHWMEDPSEAAGGVGPGKTLKANTSCPPGQKIIEQVATGGTPSEAMGMFNLSNSEFNISALTSDLRLGILPDRAVKATEVVASNQSITGIFNGIVYTIETGWVTKIIRKSWLTAAQYLNDLDSDEVSAILGPDKAPIIASMAPEDRFAQTAQGIRYKVFGMSSVLNRISDFRKITSVLQTISSSPMLAQEFAKKYSFAKLLTEILKSLDIDTDKIAEDASVIAARQQSGQNQPSSPQDLALLAANNGTDMNSQTPQMAATAPETGLAQAGGPQKAG